SLCHQLGTGNRGGIVDRSPNPSPAAVNASAQGRRSLFPVRFRGRMDLAIGLLVPTEIVGVHWVRGLSVRDYLTGFLTAPGVVSLLMFLLFAAMPTLVTRAGSVSRPN